MLILREAQSKDTGELPLLFLQLFKTLKLVQNKTVLIFLNPIHRLPEFRL